MDEVCVNPCDNSNTGLSDGLNVCQPMLQFEYRFNGWTKSVSPHATVRIPVYRMDKVCGNPCDSSGTGLTDGLNVCQPMLQFEYRFNGWTKSVSPHATVRVSV